MTLVRCTRMLHFMRTSFKNQYCSPGPFGFNLCPSFKERVWKPLKIEKMPTVNRNRRKSVVIVKPVHVEIVLLNLAVSLAFGEDPFGGSSSWVFEAGQEEVVEANISSTSILRIWLGVFLDYNWWKCQCVNMSMYCTRWGPQVLRLVLPPAVVQVFVCQSLLVFILQ